MRKIIQLFLLTVLLYSCKTFYINAWKDTMLSCEAYTIKKIEFGPDSIYLGVSPDTISVMYITMTASAKYKIDGPDYCLLSVINEKNDTIAQVAIGGMPLPGRPRTYTAYGNNVWRDKPDLNKIHISLHPYCDDIKMKQ